MSSRTANNPKRNQSLHPPLQKRPSTASGKKSSAVHSETAINGTGNRSKPSSPDQLPNGSDRTVKKLRLSKALTIPEATTVSEACRRMAQRRIDAALLTDSNGLLSGIFTDKDMVTRVLAEGLRPEQTLVSKIMTRNPIFVSSDALAIEALQTMVHGKFTHLPVVENGEVVALLDITKCLYDAISKMEKAAEQGSAIAAAVEGVERHWGSNFSSQYAFIDTLRERMFKPSLSTMITENTKVAMVLPSDPVCVAAKKMRELRVNCVVVGNGGKPQGILTSRDILMRVVANSLSPELTLVEKVMTSNPECATMETTILDALHLMHDRKFLHIPVVDHDGCVVVCLDVLQISQAAISMLDGGHGTANDTASMMMQNFWDSALPPEHHDEEFDTHSDLSATMTLEAPEAGRISNPPLNTGNSFVFKFTDQKGRVHRLNCCSESLDEFITSIKERLGPGAIQDNAQFLYEDEEGDKVLLLTDSDLVGAVNHARSLGWKVLRLHLDNLDEKETVTSPLPPPPLPSPLPSSTITIEKDGWSSVQAGVLAGAVSLASMGLMVYLRKYRE